MPVVKGILSYFKRYLPLLTNSAILAFDFPSAVDNSRISSTIVVLYLPNLACHPSHAFGHGFCVHLTDMAIGFEALSHEIGMPFACDGRIRHIGGF